MFALLVRDLLTDSVNRPIRSQLLAHIPNNATLLEIGCANGRLLMEAAPRLHYGIGIDLDRQMLAAAETRARSAHIDNLRFVCADAGRLAELEPKLGHFDIAIASLCLHAMDAPTADMVLRALGQCATTLLLVDFGYPRTIATRVAMHCDEMLAGHYSYFRNYRATGGLPTRILAAGLTIHAEEPMRARYLRLWICNGYAAPSAG